MASPITDSDLEAYVDEALSAEMAAHIEAALRADGQLAKRIAEIHQRRESGVHSLGEIWRQHRISCPSRQDLGGFLLHTLAPEHAEFIRFHIEISQCRFCQANLDDLKNDTSENESERSTRQKQYFASSAGHLKDISHRGDTE